MDIISLTMVDYVINEAIIPLFALPSHQILTNVSLVQMDISLVRVEIARRIHLEFHFVPHILMRVHVIIVRRIII